MQNLEHVLQDLVTENSDLQLRLKCSEREKQTVTQQLTAELRRKEAQLSRAEETIRREQQELRLQVKPVCGWSFIFGIV